MALVLVFSGVVSFVLFDDCTVYAADERITKPTVTFCLKMNSDNSTTTATVDMDKHTVTFSFYIKGVAAPGDFVSESAHCTSALLHLKYDTSVFTFASASGSFMGSPFFEMRNPADGLLISLTGVGNELLTISGDVVVVLNYDPNKLTRYDFTFPAELSLYSTLYKNSPAVFEKSFTASLCSHRTTKVYVHEADCQECKYTQTVCAVCGKALSEKISDNKALGNHVYDYDDITRYYFSTDNPRPSTCTAPGPGVKVWTEVRCRLCRQVKDSDGKYNDLVAVDDLEYHTNLDTSKKIMINGVYCYYCNGCKQYVECRIQEGSVEEHTHTYKDEIVVNPTCTEKGITKHTCTICQDSYTTEIAPKGHSFGSAVTTRAATCTEEGTQTKVCSVCGHVEESVIAALGHAYGTAFVTVAPTCIADGLSTSVCTRCGESTTAVIPATGEHQFTEWVDIAIGTCVKQSSQERHCTVCGHSETRTGGFGDHNYTSTIVQKRTCSDDGIIRYVCSHCGDTYDETIEASGHIFGYGITDGKSVSYKCTTCDYTVNVVTENGTKYLKITDGTFVAVIKNPIYAAMDISTIDFSWVALDHSDERYTDHGKNLAQYNAIKGTNYSIQDLYEFHLIINGEEMPIGSDTTVSITLGDALKKSKTAVIFYTEIGGQLSIQEMATATRKKLNVTFPGASLGVSANDIIILAVEGERVDTQPGTPVDPKDPGKDPSDDSSSALIPVIIIAVLVVAAGIGIAVVALSGKKNSRRRSNRFNF